MDLTQKQELYVARYLRSVNELLSGHLDDKLRDRVLMRLRGRILDQVKAAGGAHPEDTTILDVLRKLGAPEMQASVLLRVWGKQEESADGEEELPEFPVPPQPLPEPLPSRPEKPAAPSVASTRKQSAQGPAPVWLGVAGCAALMLGLPAWTIRALLILLGLFTAPLLLWAYLAAYLWLRFSGGPVVRRPLPIGRLLFYPPLLVMALSAIHFGGLYAMKGLTMAYDVWLKRPLPDMGEWAWFPADSGALLFWAIFLLLPLCLLSAMPLTSGWDYSLRRLTQAGAALYAIAVSFGIASFVTGLILAFVKEFTAR